MLNRLRPSALCKRQRRERNNQTNTVPIARSAGGAEQVFVWFVEGAEMIYLYMHREYKEDR
jgi:hypothetical protein